MPRKPWHKDESGNKYGMLTVVKYAYTHPNRGAMFECKCDCGNTTFASGGELRSGNKISCGCSRKRRRKPRADFCIECGSENIYAKNLCRRCYMKHWEEKRLQEFERYL